MAFTPTDTATWPPVLTIDQVAAIFQFRTVAALRHRCKPSSRSPFIPTPFHKRPLQWRRSDVLRVLGEKRVAA